MEIYMQPRIELIAEKKLAGKSVKMSLAKDRTPELWKGFMPERKNIKNNLSNDLFCLQVYDRSYDFKKINVNAEFDKWAAAEVADHDEIPEGMKSFLLPGGLYAVFIHIGAAATARGTFEFIFGKWLPASGYQLDARPHFEILGEKYKNNQPDSEEEVWIPIK